MTRATCPVCNKPNVRVSKAGVLLQHSGWGQGTTAWFLCDGAGRKVS